MRRPQPLIALYGLLWATTAYAAPPPPDSEDGKLMAPYATEIQSAHAPGGEPCCSLADGRPVEVREVETTDGTPHYQIRFLHPETISEPSLLYGIAPSRQWYDVPDSAILKTPLSIPYPIAWWNPWKPGIQCFWPGTLF